jgi:Domain of unknown function (DUF6946)
MSEAVFFGDDGVPLRQPGDVIRLLAKEGHWREGRSAFEAANSWFDAAEVPASIRSVLAIDPIFDRATLIKAIFEKQTSLDAFGRPSQTDILAFLKIISGTAVLGVEAKVDESFGPTVAEWSENMSQGKRHRLAGLVARLGIDPDAVAPLRYQLFHRTAAVLIEAEVAGAEDGAMIVQSFSPSSVRAGFSDFQAFAAAIGASITERDSLSKPILRDGIKLRLGWAQDRTKKERLAL